MPDYKRTKISAYTGCVSQAVITTLAPLLFIIFQTEFGLSDEQTGRLILINFGTQIFADLLATRYADKIGYRPSIITAHILCCAGLVAMSVLPGCLSSAYVGLGVATVIYALGGGFIEVLLSPIVEALPGDEKASAMSVLHSFFCWGQVVVILITTFVLRALGDAIWRWLPVCWAIVPAIGIALFAGAPLSSPAPEGKRQPARKLFRSPVFLLAILMMICSGSAELTMSQWSSLFAEKGLHVSKFMGDLLGPCLFAVTMGTGRALYGAFGSRINLRKALTALSAMCIVCYLLSVFGASALSLVGCALCGFSVSLMWPGTISMTSALFPAGGTAMFGILAISGDIGGSIGPWLAGVVSDALKANTSLATRLTEMTGLAADQLGLKAGILTGIVFPVLLLIAVLILSKQKTQKS